jgi:hypothetical protein
MSTEKEKTEAVKHAMHVAGEKLKQVKQQQPFNTEMADKLKTLLSMGDKLLQGDKRGVDERNNSGNV